MILCVTAVLEPDIYWQAEWSYLLASFATDLKLQGDFNYDGVVDLNDLKIFANAWCSSQGDGSFNAACDISLPKDNTINFEDYAVFAADWLAVSPY